MVGVADVVHRLDQPVNAVKRVGGLESLGRTAQVGHIHFGGLGDIVVGIVSVSDRVGLGVGDHTDAVGGVAERDGYICVGVRVGQDLGIGAVGDAGDGVSAADVGLRRGIKERRVGHDSPVFRVVGVSHCRQPDIAGTSAQVHQFAVQLGGHRIPVGVIVSSGHISHGIGGVRLAVITVIGVGGDSGG